MTDVDPTTVTGANLTCGPALHNEPGPHGRPDNDDHNTCAPRAKVASAGTPPSEPDGGARAGTPRSKRQAAYSRVTLYQRNHRWWIRYSLNGKQVRQSLGVTNKKDASKLAQRKDAELVLGQAVMPARKLTVADAVAAYVRHVANKGRAPGTFRAYERNLNEFARFAAARGVTHVGRLTADDLEAYTHALRTTGVAKPGGNGEDVGRRGPVKPGTVGTKVTEVKQFGNWAEASGTIARNPFKEAALPAAGAPATAVVYDAGQIAAVLRVLPEPIRDVFRFLLMTGLRREELCHLRKQDVDLDQNVIRVRVQDGWQPKRGRQRDVPLLDERARDLARRALAASAGAWLFCRPDGSRLASKADLWAPIHRAVVVLGIRGASLHTTRHSFCTYLAEGGVQQMLLERYMGHGDTNTTRRYFGSGRYQLTRNAAGNLTFDGMFAIADQLDFAAAVAGKASTVSGAPDASPSVVAA